MIDVAVVGFTAAAVLGLVVAWFAARARRPLALNHRERPVPVTLGVAIVGSAALAVTAVALVKPGDGEGGLGAHAAALAWGGLVVLAAGLVDDLRPGGPRGLTGHGKALLSGRVTTGILKVVAGLGAGTIVAASLGGSTLRVVMGVLLIAGCTNLWNLLDVVPGRALKVFLPSGLALLLAAGRGSPVSVLGAATLGAAASALPFDLAERAMLGDAGSNTLGFLVGAGCYVVLPDWGLAVVLAAVVLLHVVGETVTISRAIERVPPLRWVDGLGRLSKAGRND